MAERTCSVPDCDRPHRGRSTLVERFWPRVQKGPSYWLWTGARRHAYGEILDHGHKLYTHRVAYELTYGPLLPGQKVCHHCDTPLCVRPDHLFAGTQADNLRDCDRKGRKGGFVIPELRPRGERCHQSKLTAAQVREIRERHAQGEAIRALAQAYGVAQNSARRVIRRTSWRSVP
jgi:hypothetical protein